MFALFAGEGCLEFGVTASPAATPLKAAAFAGMRWKPWKRTGIAAQGPLACWNDGNSLQSALP